MEEAGVGGGGIKDASFLCSAPPLAPTSAMAGRDWISVQSQRPGWNREQQAVNTLGRVGPATEDAQSMEEQGIWKKDSYAMRF